MDLDAERSRAAARRLRNDLNKSLNSRTVEAPPLPPKDAEATVSALISKFRGLKTSEIPQLVVTGATPSPNPSSDSKSPASPRTMLRRTRNEQTQTPTDGGSLAGSVGASSAQPDRPSFATGTFGVLPPHVQHQFSKPIPPITPDRSDRVFPEPVTDPTRSAEAPLLSPPSSPSKSAVSLGVTNDATRSWPSGPTSDSSRAEWDVLEALDSMDTREKENEREAQLYYGHALSPVSCVGTRCSPYARSERSELSTTVGSTVVSPQARPASVFRSPRLVLSDHVSGPLANATTIGQQIFGGQRASTSSLRSAHERAASTPSASDARPISAHSRGGSESAASSSSKAAQLIRLYEEREAEVRRSPSRPASPVKRSASPVKSSVPTPQRVLSPPVVQPDLPRPQRQASDLLYRPSSEVRWVHCTMQLYPHELVIEYTPTDSDRPTQRRLNLTTCGKVESVRTRSNNDGPARAPFQLVWPDGAVENFACTSAVKRVDWLTCLMCVSMRSTNKLTQIKGQPS